MIKKNFVMIFGWHRSILLGLFVRKPRDGLAHVEHVINGKLRTWLRFGTIAIGNSLRKSDSVPSKISSWRIVQLF